MLRILNLIFSLMILFPQISFSSTDDFGGGNEQGNAGKGELCEKYNICIKKFESNSLDVTVFYLRQLQREDSNRYQALEQLVFDSNYQSEDFNLFREAFAIILSESSS